MLCREDEFSRLGSNFRHPDLKLPGSIILFGPPQSGKHLLAKSVLLSCPHLKTAIVSCQSATFHSKMIFQSALDQWSEPEKNLIKAETLADFVRVLTEQGSDILGDKKGLVLVLRKAEKLRDLEFNLLAGFLRLQEWTCLNISVLLLTSISFNKFLLPSGLEYPDVFTLKSYSEKQLCEIIAKKLKAKNDFAKNNGEEEFPLEFYQNYVSMVINFTYQSCKSLPRLGQLADSHFHVYANPVRNNEVKADNVRTLYRQIEKPLRESLNSINLQESNSKQLLMDESKNDPSSHSTLPSLTANQKRLHVELPFHSKFLLIASYLASYNPVKSDRRFFMKNHGKQRKTKAMLKSKENNLSTQLSGPKVFPMDRMMAIFYAIIEEEIAPSANILSQISSLVTLEFLTQVSSSGDALETPKYRCAVGLQFIHQLSKQVGFEVHKYLYDFV